MVKHSLIHIVIEDEEPVEPFTWVANQVQDVGDEWGYAGTVESDDEVLHASARNLVHTYRYTEDGDPGYFQSIYIDCFISDQRYEHHSYLVAPSMDFYLDDEWIDGPLFGGEVISKDETHYRDYSSSYYVGLAFSNNNDGEDLIIPFRARVNLYIDWDDTGEYQFAETLTDSGLWYYDVGDYNEAVTEGVLR